MEAEAVAEHLAGCQVTDAFDLFVDESFYREYGDTTGIAS